MAMLELLSMRRMLSALAVLMLGGGAMSPAIARDPTVLAQLPQHFEKIRRAGIFLDLFWA
jgi:hypothetical protein